LRWFGEEGSNLGLIRAIGRERDGEHRRQSPVKPRK
jgi:hypothetical protein